MANAYITGLPAADALTGDELLDASQLSATVTITASTISAQASDNSFNDSGSGFLAAGFALGNRVRVQGFTGNAANNLFVGVVTDLAAGKMTIGGTDGDVIVDDSAGESVTISKWESRRATTQEIADLAAASGTYVPPAVSTQSGTSYIAVLGDANTFIRFTNASPVTFTIPPNSSVAFPIGTEIHFSQSGAGALSVAAGLGVTINSRASDLSLAGQYAVAFVKQVAADTWIMNGDL